MQNIHDLENLPLEERKKIGEFLHNDDKPNSWMYEEPKKQAEDFLLGKPVKSLDELVEISRDQDEETPIERLSRLDMQAKFREDPLNLMRQHEYDKRSALLQNTAKMKKLKRLLEQQKHHQKKKVKEKRRKRKRNISDSSTESDDDSILNKFISLIQHTDSNDVHEITEDNATEKIETPKMSKHREKKHKKRRHHHHHHHHHQDSKCQLEKVGVNKNNANKDFSQINQNNLLLASESTVHAYRPNRDRQIKTKTVKTHHRLSKEEKNALREQMAVNAKERDQERTERFNKHQQEKMDQELAEINNKLDHGPSFLKKMTLEHVSNTSIEDGVHRKANSRQRGGTSSIFLRK